MFKLSKFIALFIVLLLPSLAWGADFFTFESSNSDKSIYYLGQTFGSVGTVLGGEGASVFSALFQAYNYVILTLGAIVISYTVLMATIQTASEGSMMGRRWSAFWIPAKAAAGLSLLIPTASGYSIIQILMMWVIMQGIHGGNQILYFVLDQLESGVGFSSNIEVDDSVGDTAINLFKSMVCLNMLNTDEYAQDQLGGQQVEIYKPASRLDEIWIGVENDPTYQNICGTVRAAPYADVRNSVANQNQWIARQLDGAELAMDVLNQYAQEAAESPNQLGDWSGENIIPSAINQIRGQLSNVQLSTGGGSGAFSGFYGSGTMSGDLYDLARQDGWIHMGVYYQRLVSTKVDLKFKPPVTQRPPVDRIPLEMGGPAGNAWDFVITPLAYRYLKRSEINDAGSGDFTLEVTEPSGLNSKARSAMGDTVNVLGDLTLLFIEHMAGRDGDDPVVSFGKFGTDIMFTTEILFWAFVILLPLLMLVLCVMNINNPGCYVMGPIIVILMPILVTLIALLWGAGVTCGLYVPLIPFLVFTFTAIGWMILCIETIVAAPIVALGITAPGHDYMGKAVPAVMLITNVFLRPSLILIGFIAAGRLLKPVIGMLNWGFESFMYQVAGNLMVFGNIALIVIYAGICTAAIHQVFSLTHVLPDKILKWIGGSAEQSQVEQAMMKAEQSAAKAGQVTGGLMKGGAEAATKSMKGMAAKHKKDSNKMNKGVAKAGMGIATGGG